MIIVGHYYVVGYHICWWNVTYLLNNYLKISTVFATRGQHPSSSKYVETANSSLTILVCVPCNLDTSLKRISSNGIYFNGRLTPGQNHASTLFSTLDIGHLVHWHFKEGDVFVFLVSQSLVLGGPHIRLLTCRSILSWPWALSTTIRMLRNII